MTNPADIPGYNRNWPDINLKIPDKTQIHVCFKMIIVNNLLQEESDGGKTVLDYCSPSKLF